MTKVSESAQAKYCLVWKFSQSLRVFFLRTCIFEDVLHVGSGNHVVPIHTSERSTSFAQVCMSLIECSETLSISAFVRHITSPHFHGEIFLDPSRATSFEVPHDVGMLILESLMGRSFFVAVFDFTIISLLEVSIGSGLMRSFKVQFAQGNLWGFFTNTFRHSNLLSWISAAFSFLQIFVVREQQLV